MASGPAASGRRPATAYARATRDVVRDVLRWRDGQPSSRRTYMVARTLHRHTAGRSSRLALAALRRVPGSPDHGRRAGSPLPGEWAAALVALREDGVTYLPSVISAESVDRVVSFARTAPGYGRLTTQTAVPAVYADRPADAAAVNLISRYVLNNPDIQAVIAHPLLAQLARDYFGIGAVIHPPQLYWTCAGAELLDHETKAELAREFHWDYDGLRGLRLHLYLTDVDENSGPMQYLARSHHPGGRRPRAADFGVTEDEVWRCYNDGDLRTMTGPAGTAFVSDSQGLHRGTDPRTRDRLFMVIPIQATGFAGYQLAQRFVTPKDPTFAAGLADGRPELRLFVADA